MLSKIVHFKIVLLMRRYPILHSVTSFLITMAYYQSNYQNNASQSQLT